MKQPTRKTSILALVGTPNRSTGTAQDRAAVLKESFDGWLDSVAPTLLQSTGEGLTAAPKRSRRSLSYTDVIRVNRATIRESTAPRLWPPDVVLSFLAAEVIKRNDKQ